MLTVLNSAFSSVVTWIKTPKSGSTDGASDRSIDEIPDTNPIPAISTDNNSRCSSQSPNTHTYSATPTNLTSASESTLQSLHTTTTTNGSTISKGSVIGGNSSEIERTPSFRQLSARFTPITGNDISPITPSIDNNTTKKRTLSIDTSTPPLLLHALSSPVNQGSAFGSIAIQGHNLIPPELIPALKDDGRTRHVATHSYRTPTTENLTSSAFPSVNPDYAATNKQYYYTPTKRHSFSGPKSGSITSPRSIALQKRRNTTQPVISPTLKRSVTLSNTASPRKQQAPDATSRVLSDGEAGHTDEQHLDVTDTRGMRRNTETIAGDRRRQRSRHRKRAHTAAQGTDIPPQTPQLRHSQSEVNHTPKPKLANIRTRAFVRDRAIVVGTPPSKRFKNEQGLASTLSSMANSANASDSDREPGKLPAFSHQHSAVLSLAVPSKKKRRPGGKHAREFIRSRSKSPHDGGTNSRHNSHSLTVAAAAHRKAATSTNTSSQLPTNPHLSRHRSGARVQRCNLPPPPNPAKISTVAAKPMPIMKPMPIVQPTLSLADKSSEFSDANGDPLPSALPLLSPRVSTEKKLRISTTAKLLASSQVSQARIILTPANEEKRMGGGPMAHLSSIPSPRSVDEDSPTGGGGSGSDDYYDDSEASGEYSYVSESGSYIQTDEEDDDEAYQSESVTFSGSAASAICTEYSESRRSDAAALPPPNPNTIVVSDDERKAVDSDCDLDDNAYRFMDASLLHGVTCLDNQRQIGAEKGRIYYIDNVTIPKDYRKPVYRPRIPPDTTYEEMVKNGSENVHASKILSNLWLGPLVAAHDEEFLTKNHITGVFSAMSLVNEIPFYEDCAQAVFVAQDCITLSVLPVLPSCVQIIEALLGCHCHKKDALTRIRKSKYPKRCQMKRNILIHCKQGASRSASLLIAFLMWHEEWTFDAAFRWCKRKRALVYPNLSFVAQLTIFEFILQYFRNGKQMPPMAKRKNGNGYILPASAQIFNEVPKWRESVLKLIATEDNWIDACKQINIEPIGWVFRHQMRCQYQLLRELDIKLYTSSPLRRELRALSDEESEFVHRRRPNCAEFHQLSEFAGFFLNLGYYNMSRQFPQSWLDTRLLAQFKQMFPFGSYEMFNDSSASNVESIVDYPLVRELNTQLRAYVDVINKIYISVADPRRGGVVNI